MITSTRPVRCTVTSVRVGKAIVDSFDLHTKLKSGRIYRVPLYRMRLAGYDDSKRLQYYDFKVIRFGVGYYGSGPDFIAGKDEHGVHILRWNKYMGGSWKLSGYKQVLIHDGADYPRRQAYGAVGCIEVTGVGEWKNFLEKVKELSGNSDPREIGKQGKFKCELLRAVKPHLRRA